MSLARVLASDAPTACGTVTPKAFLKPVASVAVKSTGGRSYKTRAMFSTCVAACLAMAVVWLANSRPADPPLLKSQIAWGWAKAGGLAAEQSSPRDYLTSLATTAEEWSQYQPGDANGVTTRILELRLGCVRLMHSSYGPLGPTTSRGYWNTVENGRRLWIDTNRHWMLVPIRWRYVPQWTRRCVRSRRLSVREQSR